MSVGYWYVRFTDAPTQFFRDEEALTEAEWRAGAPANQIAQLEAEAQAPGTALFPKDVGAS